MKKPTKARRRVKPLPPMDRSERIAFVEVRHGGRKTRDIRRIKGDGAGGMLVRLEPGRWLKGRGPLAGLYVCPRKAA